MIKNYVKLIVALLFVSNVMAQNVPSYVPTNGLVGWWPFNGNANDESGKGNNGTVNGATLSTDRNGKTNSAYSVDNGNYIIVNNLKELPLNNSKRSLCFWMNSTQTNNPDNRDMIYWGNANTSERYGVTMFSKLPYFCSQNNDFFGKNTIGDGSWHFVVVNYDGSNVQMFVDGKFDSEEQKNLNTIGADFIVGRSPLNHPNWTFYSGQIDDIVIYNRVLTQQEITSLYTGTPVAQNVPSYVPTNGLVGWWPFNGNANDESGNGNNGTVNGATLTADRNGVLSGAYSFYNVNDYIDISTNNGKFDNQNYTISFWIRSNQTSTSPSGGPNVNPAIISRLINGGQSASNPYANSHADNWVIYEIGGGVNLSSYTGGMDGSTSNILGNVWNNILFIKDGQTVKTFKNGQLVTTNANLYNMLYKNYSIRLGRSSHTYWKDFSGELDDIAIYNRALTQQEITALYNGSNQSALASTKVFVDAPSTVSENQEVEMSISTEALSQSDNVISFQTDLAYDVSRFEYVSNNLTGTLNSSATAVVNASQNGKLTISYMSQTALSNAGSLLKLKFKANKNLGQGIFSLADFMYNNTAIANTKSDTVTILDVTPPTAKIIYSQNPLRKGDSLLITVKFNEKMADAPITQLRLTGENTLTNSNLTKVNDTTYTYWWVVEKGNGLVNVTLASGKDVGGNVIVATPTQNASFTVLPTLFGDIDTNKFVRAFDAALALQYSVGLNPLPTMDPLPWSNWRIAVANVDTVGLITANDASLILQHSAKVIATFPADAKKRGGDAPVANVTVTQEGNQLVFRATGTLYALNVFMKDNFNVLGQPDVKNKSAMLATNINATTYNVGLASTTPFVENEPFLVIPILTNENVQGTMDIVANSQERSLSYGKAAGITAINKEAVIVYPNPTKDIVTINNAEGNTLRIVDAQGKQVYNQKVTTSTMELSMKTLGSKGMYVLHIVDSNNESVQTKQIVLE